MPAQKFDDILKDLRKKVYYPVYFLQGEEPYFIDVISDYIAAHVLDDMAKEFNQTIVYGKETDILSVLGAAKRYPMMSDKQVVIVKEAQELKVFSKKETSKDEDKKDEASFLLNYIQNPQPSTVLVFCHKYKSVDKRTKLGKTIEQKAQFLDAKKLYTDKVPDWIAAYLKQKGYKIEERASALIAEYLGTELSKISNEVDKMLLNVDAYTIIGVKHVEEHIGISHDYNVFALHNAIGEKDVLKANRIINYFNANPRSNPLVMTMGSLFGYFNKVLLYQTLRDKANAATELGVNPYFVRDYEKASRNYPLIKLEKIAELLREYDLKSKGVNNSSTSEGELLKELVYRILH